MWINFIVFLLIKILSGTFYGKESTQVSKHGSTICKAFQYEEEYICRSNKIHIVAGFVFGFFFFAISNVIQTLRDNIASNTVQVRAACVALCPNLSPQRGHEHLSAREGPALVTHRERPPD